LYSISKKKKVISLQDGMAVGKTTLAKNHNRKQKFFYSIFGEALLTGKAVVQEF